MSKPAVDKVLLIGGDLQARGSVTYTLNLAKGLLKRGCEVLVTSRGGPMLGAFERRGIQVQQSDQLGKPVYDLFTFGRYLRSIAPRGFKLIHVQHRAELRRGLRAARALRVPVVLTMHHFFEPHETFRLPRKYVCGVIAVSQAIRENLVNDVKVPRGLIKLVSTGVDLTAASDCRRRRRENQIPVIGTVGMLTRIKGNDYFLRAAREVLDRGFGAHFVVAGQGPESSRLRKQARDLKLTRNITFVTDFSENYEVLCALDVLVTPSLREGLGLTVLQAMACGVPTVSTASGGIQTFVKDGQTGIMVPQRDPVGLAMAIIRFIEDPRFSDKISSNASKMVEQEYPLEKMTDEVLDFYSEVVGKWDERAKSA